MKYHHSIFLLLIVAFLSANAQNKKQSLDRYFSALIANDQFNGNVLVAENGKVIYQRSAGYSDFSTHTPNTKNTLFALASISKTITATAILQLAQAGKLNVDDPVIKYLPQFPYPDITIRHLLSHTSGLPPYNVFFDSVRKQHPEKVFTNKDFLTGLAANKKPLIYRPGDRGNYDNINFIVLALVIEKVSGSDYSGYIQKNILDRAGMHHTLFLPLKAQYAQTVNNKFAFPHLFPHLYSDSIVRANKVSYISDYWSAYNFTGFSDYVTTVEDLLKYDEAYYNGKLLNSQTEKNAFVPVKQNSGTTNPGNFGLGWEIEVDTSLGKIIYHSGNATGLSCVLLRNISKHQTVIVFDNIHTDNSHSIASNVMKILNGLEVPHPKKSIANIYARTLLHKGSEAASAELEQLKKDTTNYFLSEDEMNNIGYDFMGGPNNPNPYRIPEEHKDREALEILKLNMELFPGSWNVYDSYGEILLKMGQKDEAARMYRKSIELNPKNEGGKMALEQIAKMK
jgi:CubicO group peptidase (beta-lactamase class C family)